MDHWGDPWADDADADADTNAHAHTTIATPAKVATELRAAAPQGGPLTPSSFKPAPIVLNGFLDDAGWGSDAWARTPSPRKERDDDGGFGGEDVSWGAEEDNNNLAGRNEEDEGFSAWAASPAKNEDVDVSAGGRAADSLPDWDAPHGHDDGVERVSLEKEVGNEWSRIEEVVEGSKDGENGIEETSDSATTIQPDDKHAKTDAQTGGNLHREDDASTRSSESHSDGSHNEAVTESPRTSIEEDRGVGKSAEAIKEDVKEEGGATRSTENEAETVEEVEDDFGDFEDEVEAEVDEPPLDEEFAHGRTETSSKTSEDVVSDLQDASKALSALSGGPAGSFILDSKLMAELFPPAKDGRELEDPPDDPVSSTSTRKAWYRLMRKQTMREYNHGALDDNYIRVTWKTSHIKAEATKTVARWATEDRIAGRGPGARASFFWDTPHSPTDKRASFASLHSRKTSAASVSKPVRPVSQSVPPLSTDVPAAFDWSSPSSAAHPAPHQASVRSTSSPITAKHSAITKLQRQGGRAASVDLSSPRVPVSHRRTSTTTEVQSQPRAASPPRITPIEAPPRASFDPWGSSNTSSPVVSVPASSTGKSDPWASLGALDTNSPTKPSSTTPADDDDEWGEMIESPAVSTVETPVFDVQTPVVKAPETPARDKATPRTTTTPISARSSPVQPLPPLTGPVAGTPIMRLKGTVSPTSALFKPNALVPTDSQERIGPHLLKKRDRSREATPEKTDAEPVQMPNMDEILGQPPAKESVADIERGTDELATAPPPPTSQPDTETTNLAEHNTNPTPPPPTDDQSTWATDADFSIFESALPPSVPTSTSGPASSQPDPTDPWSIFDSPEPPAPYVRPTQRPVTPPTKQPLTSATSSAQRRKVEEEEVVRGIMEGLPDLGYMLR